MADKKDKIYMKSFDEAVAAGEVKLYHADMAKCTECAQAIDKAIDDCYKGDYIYDIKGAVQSAVNNFGLERVKFVTAIHLHNHEYDGRFSKTNKDWAKAAEIPHIKEYKYIFMKSHSTVLDGFADRLREFAEKQEPQKVGSYRIKKSVLFSDNRGFAFAESKTAVSPFVSWQFKVDSENGERDYFWGRYHSNKDDAVADFKRRVEDYKNENRVVEVKEQLPAVSDSEQSTDINLRRFMGVDLIDFLGRIAEKTIVYHHDDWNIDKDWLYEVAASDNPEDKRLMWHCCSYGTHMLKEREVFIMDTGAFHYWTDYRQNDPDMVGYFVEVTGHDSQTITGNVFEVGGYAEHAKYIRETAIPLDSVTLTYSDDWGVNAGKTVTVPRREYDDDRNRLMSESGNVIAIRYNPVNESELTELLRRERAVRMSYPIGSVEEHLKKLADKLSEIRTPTEQNGEEKPDKSINEMTESEKEFALWQAKTESSRFTWTEDEIFRLNGRGVFYYIGGENGQFIKANNDGLLEVGRYEDAFPHIGEASFIVTAEKQYNNYNEAFETMVKIGGKKFLADMFSGGNIEDYKNAINIVEVKEKADKQQLTGMAKLRQSEKDKRDNPAPPVQKDKSDRANRKKSDIDL